MHNQFNPSPLFSFIVVPSPYQFYTMVSISPPPIDNATPTSQNTLHSSSFNPSFIQHYYINQENNNSLPISTTSIQNPPTSNPIPIKDTNIINTNKSILRISSESESNINLSRFSSNRNDTLQPQKRQASRQKICIEDEDKDYLPKGERKRPRNTKYFENQNRNVVPNQVNQIFSFIQKQSKSGYLTKKLISKFSQSPNYTVKRFYLYQKLLKNKLGHYTNQNSLKLVNELYEPRCENWPEQEQRYYNKICRILIRHFLLEDSIFIILTSKRMKREKKGEHIRARRYVGQAVLKILRG